MYFSMFLAPRVSGPGDDKDAIYASVDQALEADEAGFAAVYLGEQHHNNYEPYSDPFTMGGWLGGQFRQAWIGTSVVPLVLHHPLMLQERMNALDLLMAGRVIYGISSGQPSNGTAFGIHHLDAETRARLFEQRLDVLLRAWAHGPQDGPFEFRTEREEGVMDGRIMPASYRVPHPMFAIATNRAAKVRQAGQRGFHVHLGPTEFGACLELADLYQKGLREGGCDETVIEQRTRWFINTKWIIVGETDDAAWKTAEQLLARAAPPWITQEARLAGLPLRQLHYHPEPGPFAASFGGAESAAAWTQRCHIIGSPETVAHGLQAYADAGLPHVHARWMINEHGIEASQKSFRLFVDEVMPRLGVHHMPPPQPDELRPEFRHTSASIA